MMWRGVTEKENSPSESISSPNSPSTAYLLDIVIDFFCQTKCCGTTVISGDKLVIAPTPDLTLLLSIFRLVIHSETELPERGFSPGVEKVSGTG
jgi:hypothetical protein